MLMKDLSHSSQESAPSPLLSALHVWRFVAVVGSVCCVGLMGAIALQPFFSVGDLTRDPAAIALHPPYFGVISNLGILLWSASAAVCFLSGVLLKLLRPARPDLRFFFTVFAVLSTVLCLDDTFLLHEAILPNRLPLVKIPEPVVIMAYGLALVGSVVYFRKLLFKNQPLLFGLIVLLFAVSVGFDLLLPPDLLSEDTVYLIEDGVKLLAIFLWLAYFVRASLCYVVPPQFALSTQPPAAAESSPLDSSPLDSSLSSMSAGETHH